MRLEAFNDLDTQAMEAELVSCCHCAGWSRRVSSHAPFDSLDQLRELAADSWQAASEDERLEAFSGHPQIGDLSALRNRFAKTASSEQGQVTEASEEVLRDLKSCNEAYLEKFGFIFVVCATGRSAAEMLELVRQRLPNSRDEELDNGAREQGKITDLRILRLIEE